MTEPVVQAPKTVVGAVGQMIAPQDPDLVPGAGVGRVTSTDSLVETLAPAVHAPLDDALPSLDDVVEPLQEGAQPAMTMLSGMTWAEAGPDQS